jgi:hypothetical protein
MRWGRMHRTQQAVSPGNAVIPVMVSLHEDLGRSRLLGRPYRASDVLIIKHKKVIAKRRIRISTN